MGARSSTSEPGHGPSDRASSIDDARRASPSSAAALDGAYEVDPWGLDLALVELLSPVSRSLRYGIDVDRPERLPAEGPALLVANRRLRRCPSRSCSPAACASPPAAHVRTVGVPDVAPVGPLLRRLGGVLARPDEVAGLLRAGEVVGVLLDRDVRAAVARRRRARQRCSQPAFELGVPVVPVALVGRELGRAGGSGSGRRSPTRDGRGPLALAALADRARAGVQELLDEALPPRGLVLMALRRSTSDGIRLRYDVVGRRDAEPLLHDPGPRRRQPGLDPPAPRTSPVGYRVITFDNRGVGRSPTSRSAPTTSSAWPSTPSRCSTPSASTPPT